METATEKNYGLSMISARVIHKFTAEAAEAWHTCMQLTVACGLESVCVSMCKVQDAYMLLSTRLPDQHPHTASITLPPSLVNDSLHMK